MKRVRFGALLLLLGAIPAVATAANPHVRMTTTLGAFDIELCAESSTLCTGDAPATVANFLRYVDGDEYPPTSFIDFRSVGPADLLVQGGNVFIVELPNGEFSYDYVEDLGPIPIEVGRGLSNVRGTIAAARIIGRPDLGVSSWFLNVTNNSVFDTEAGGFAVFGVVVSGMAVVDQIAAVPIYPCAGPPLIDYPGCTTPPTSAIPHLVYVTSVERVPEPGSAGAGVASALALAWLRRRREAASRGGSDYLSRP